MSINTIVLGGGCFWCTEAIFQNLSGVQDVVSGYSGGDTINPTYDEVCTGKSGHAEVIKVAYDEKVVSLEELLILFFKTHDPTTLNQQGADKGTQYRSIILYNTQIQKNCIEKIIKQITLANVYDNPIVTEVAPLKTFYEAEKYHQNFYNNNPYHGYCNVVIKPKLSKLKTILNKK